MSVLNEKDHNVVNNISKKRSANQLYKQVQTNKDEAEQNNIKKVKVNNYEDMLIPSKGLVKREGLQKAAELPKISIQPIDDHDDDFFDIGPELTSTPTRRQNIFLEPESSDFSTGNDSYDESVILPMNFNHTNRVGMNLYSTHGEYLNEVRELTPYTKFLCDDEMNKSNIGLHESSS